MINNTSLQDSSQKQYMLIISGGSNSDQARYYVNEYINNAKITGIACQMTLDINNPNKSMACKSFLKEMVDNFIIEEKKIEGDVYNHIIRHLHDKQMVKSIHTCDPLQTDRFVLVFEILNP